MAVGKWETCFWFSIFPSAAVVGLWECGYRAAISKDCGKTGVLSISLSFPQVRFLVGRRFGFRFFGLLDSIARDVQLEDHGVVYQAVNGRGCRHRVLKDALSP